jgi:transcriptional regulator with XRE-family HTH domain
MLTGPQEITLNRLLQGDTQREAADAAGVAPETVSRWLQDVEFTAELDRRREEVWRDLRRQLIQTSTTALEVLEALMKGGENDQVKLRAAVAVLKLAPPRIDSRHAM